MTDQTTLIAIIAIMILFGACLLAWGLANHSARIAELEQAMLGDSAIDNSGLDE
jgi:hypothetical protein